MLIKLWNFTQPYLKVHLQPEEQYSSSSGTSEFVYFVRFIWKILHKDCFRHLSPTISPGWNVLKPLFGRGTHKQFSNYKVRPLYRRIVEIAKTGASSSSGAQFFGCYHSGKVSGIMHQLEQSVANCKYASIERPSWSVSINFYHFLWWTLKSSRTITWMQGCLLMGNDTPSR